METNHVAHPHLETTLGNNRNIIKDHPRLIKNMKKSMKIHDIKDNNRQLWTNHNNINFHGFKTDNATIPNNTIKWKDRSPTTDNNNPITLLTNKGRTIKEVDINLMIDDRT